MAKHYVLKFWILFLFLFANILSSVRYIQIIMIVLKRNIFFTRLKK